ncbi:MAG: prenyltransferase [Gammaproteobacteria bacterium]|nr:prenyltransferase [Gammaproteobacteria bacterium]
MKALEHYSFSGSLRPFSLAVAVVSTGLGLVLAWQEGFRDVFLLTLILAGSVLAQAGINLINDLEDLQQTPQAAIDAQSRRLIVRNARIGFACFFLAGLIGAYFIALRGWPMFWMLVFSAFLALNYNMGPLNFKHRGLAVFQVFVLMGVVLVQGAYMAMSGHFSLQAASLSVPISLLVSLLLLSNELRDWEVDRDKQVRTLTVRIGYDNAVRLYWGLIILAYLLALLLLGLGELEQVWWLLLPLPVLIPISRYMRANQRRRLTPLTGRFFLLFGVAFILSL